MKLWSELVEKVVDRGDFHTLLEEGDTAELVVTFMSVLELMLRGDVNVEQSNNFENLTVSYVRAGEESHE